MFGHLVCALWSPDLERNRAAAPWPADPAGEPEISETNDVVRVMMGEADACNVSEGYSQLVQPL